ncbi:putative universal stress protein [Nocardia nova SH22a]|uniref:Putative universal stress protein n=1 Tax=Nocardia nova SH22a TaxID=1415166 RepID=W5TKH0_9NOCA|nr:universal stress protein [Nocardia nova]AHH19669.1 putative universal stress protein [Nocardia nova SH22a]
MTHSVWNDARHLASAPVVAGVDGSAAADTALDWAAGLAAQRGRELRIVFAIDLNRIQLGLSAFDAPAAAIRSAARTKGADLVARAARRVRAVLPGLRISTEVAESDPVTALVEESAAAYAVVLAARGTSRLAGHFGSTVAAVTAAAAGPVLVVRTDPHDGDRVHGEGPVVVGVDGSAISEQAIGAAFEEAAERGAGLVAVHVCHDIYSGEFADEPHLLYSVPDIEIRERALLSERLAGWQEKYPDVAVTHRVSLTDPVTALLDASKSAQLLVVGSRGRGGVRAMLGSTSRSLVQHARCPVMVVHPQP